MHIPTMRPPGVKKNALFGYFLIFQDGLLWTFGTKKCVESNSQQLLDSILGLSTHKKKVIQENLKIIWPGLEVASLQGDFWVWSPNRQY